MARAFGKEVLIVGLSLPVARLMSCMGILDRIRETHRFATRREALEFALQWLSGDEARAGDAAASVT